MGFILRLHNSVATSGACLLARIPFNPLRKCCGMAEYDKSAIEESENSEHQETAEEAEERGEYARMLQAVSENAGLDARAAAALKADMEKLTDDPRAKRVRNFKCVIENIQVKNVSEKCDPYIKFSIGGNYRVEDRRHKGGRIAAVGVRKSIIRTEKKKNIMSGGSASYEGSYTRYWKGTYEDLEKETLHIEVWDWDLITFNDWLGQASIPLVDLARGPVDQSIEMHAIHKSGSSNVRRIPCEVSFRVVFQEMFVFKLQLHDWFGRHFRAADASGSSDPYLKFAIPRRTRDLFTRSLHKGGYFHRRGKSKVRQQSLNPKWDGHICTLSFYGTRNELENADLRIEAWDWDLLGSNDLLGTATVPLRGIVEYGYIQSAIAMRSSGSGGGGKRRESSGTIEGYVTVSRLPRHEQYGELVSPRPDREYLAVHVKSATNLDALDGNGYSDSFVVVEWDGLRQQTKVMAKELNPFYDEVLYFPLRYLNLDADEFSRKPAIRINVYDHDEDGNDLLGDTEVSLAKITRSRVQSVAQVGAAGSVNTRVFERNLTLNRQGRATTSSVLIRAYFTPDLPPELVLDDAKGRKKRRGGDTGAGGGGSGGRMAVVSGIPAALRSREVEFRRLLSNRDGTFRHSAVDETLTERFLPSYLCPMNPPLELRDPRKIARMIHCFTHTADSEIYHADDVWATPNFMMNIKKGDSEDHALLHANLLLGLHKDAYVCLGTLKNTGVEHTWVMTREDDGSVVFWESQMDARYILRGAWRGEADHVPGRSNAPEAGESSGVGGKLAAMLFRGGGGGSSSGGGFVSSRTIFDEDVMFYDVPSGVDFHVDDVSLSSVCEGVDMDILRRNALSRAAAAQGDSKSVDMVVVAAASSSSGDEKSPGGFQQLPYASIGVVFNHRNLWANLQAGLPERLHFDFDAEDQWLGFIPSASKAEKALGDSDDEYYDSSSDEDAADERIVPFYLPNPLPPKLPDTRVEYIGDLIVKEVMAGYMALRYQQGMDETRFEQKALRAVLERGLRIMETRKTMDDRHFRQQKQRLADLIDEMRQVTRRQAERVQSAAAAGTATAKAKSLVVNLLDRKRLRELRAKIKEQTGYINDLELDRWESLLQARVPAGMHFYGVPVHFCYYDSRRIREWITKHYDFHTEKDPNVRYACGCYVKPFHGGVVSTWVFICKLMPTTTAQTGQHERAVIDEDESGDDDEDDGDDEALAGDEEAY